MFLGLLFAGMSLGALLALFWVAAGGSILFAIGLYSLAATAFVLCGAVLTYLMSERQERETVPILEAMHAAE
jgi:hypothetical protein